MRATQSGRELPGSAIRHYTGNEEAAAMHTGIGYITVRAETAASNGTCHANLLSHVRRVLVGWEEVRKPVRDCVYASRKCRHALLEHLITVEMYRLHCSFCKLDFHGVFDLTSHLETEKHRDNARAAGQRVSSLQQKRLQYMMETFLRKEPVLGLEYIVEERDPTLYVYSCLLCNVRAPLLEALQHILSPSHVVGYIRKHHDHMWPKHPHKESLGEGTLRDIAMAIQKKEGRQNIHPKTSDTTTTGSFPWLFHLSTNGSCNFCGGTFHISTLKEHVRSKKHKTLVKQGAPELLKEQERLQYLLDTHFREEPILGLEYIVEKLTQSSVYYKYTCLLCHVQYNGCEMVSHLLSCEHMTQYIDRHHSELSLSGKDYESKEDFQKDLRRYALMICKKSGKQTIQVRAADVTDLDLTSLLPEEDDCRQNGDLISNDQVTGDKNSCLKDSRALQPSPRDVKELNDTAVVQEVEDDSSHYSRKPTVKKCYCSLCGVSTPSVFTHCIHIMGKTHSFKLKRATSEQVKEKDRLQYILDTYMKKAVILGLEYLVEREMADSYYSYTCRLCNVKARLSDALTHILDKEHTVRYMEREHKDLLPHKSSTMSLHNKAFTETALLIQERYGRKEIQVKNEKNSEEAEITAVEELESRRNDTCSCSLCGATFSVTDLPKHVMGKEHRVNWESASPELVEELGRLKYLLDVYLKDCPLLGLEYILEMQMDSGYRYICMLCNLETGCYQTIDHMTGEDHLTKYIDRHHRKLSLQPDMFPQKEDYENALIMTAFHICTTYGRKDIRIKRPKDSGIRKRTSNTLEVKSLDSKKRRLENVQRRR